MFAWSLAQGVLDPLDLFQVCPMRPERFFAKHATDTWAY